LCPWTGLRLGTGRNGNRGCIGVKLDAAIGEFLVRAVVFEKNDLAESLPAQLKSERHFRKRHGSGGRSTRYIFPFP
jgi:hypothetical protein